MSHAPLLARAAKLKARLAKIETDLGDLRCRADYRALVKAQILRDAFEQLEAQSRAGRAVWNAISKRLRDESDPYEIAWLAAHHDVHGEALREMISCIQAKWRAERTT